MENFFMFADYSVFSLDHSVEFLDVNVRSLDAGVGLRAYSDKNFKQADTKQ